MIGLDQILNKCADGITAAFITALHHIGYVIQYKENIQNLEDETDKLGIDWTSINGRVQRAKNNVEIIEPGVEKWLKDADQMKDQVTAFLADRVRENKWCFKCWCPDIYWRYRLGKQSKLKTTRVITLRDEGTEIMKWPAVSHPAPPPEFGFTFSEDYNTFDSRAKLFEEIMKALEDPGIKMVGVYGPGGVGKTTMVVEIGKLAKSKGLFDDVAMAVVSRILDKKIVQGHLARDLQLTLGEDDRAGRLHNRLNNGKKNLVILDDVWEPLNLADIGIPITIMGGNHNSNNQGCKIVVTSRKQRVCQMMQKSNELKNFPIQVLTETEAWSLFTKVAEISINSEMPPAAKDVCDECGGLPVAICAVAAALKGKDKYAWNDGYRQLKNSNLKEIVDIDPKLFSSLKLSYDFLTPKDAQSCFLLCSLFPEDAVISIDDLVRYCFGMRLLDQIYLNSLEDVRERVLTLVDGLKSSCLLLDVKYQNGAKMHDVIRDVAISIAEDEKGYLVKHDIEKWPEKGTYEHCSAISLRFTKNIHELPNELECRGLHTLVLKCSYDSRSDIPNKFFNGMENNLEVLDLSEMPIESLPSSLSTLVKLRMLSLNGQLRDITLLARLRNLEILSLHRIEDRRGLFELKYAEVKGYDDGEHLLGTPERFLETQLQSLHWSFRNLCQLYVQNCRFKFLFPISIARGFVRLQYLEIKDCVDMEEIIRNERQGDNDEIIFHQLKKIVLEGILNLRSFCSSTKSTSTTEANNSYPLQPLFCEKVAFPALERLIITGVHNILVVWDKQLKPPIQEEKESFCQLRNLEHLRSLSIGRCSKLKAIVAANREGGANDKPLVFPELLSLRLFDLENLRSFFGSYGLEEEEEEITKHELHVEILQPHPLFSEKVLFPRLEELFILWSNNMKELWISTPPTNSFNNLRDLTIWNCHKLLYVGPSELLGSLQNLQSLWIQECSSIEEVFIKTRGSNTGEGIIVSGDHDDDEATTTTTEQVQISLVLPRLNKVVLSDLPRLRKFCPGYKLPHSILQSTHACPLLESSNPNMPNV